MYKEITIADAVNGKIYLRAVSFATQMLYKIISDDNWFEEFENASENQLAFEILCSNFTYIMFEHMSMREYIYTDAQGIYICTFAASVIYPLFFGKHTSENIKKDRKTKFKNEYTFSNEFCRIIFDCLKDFDRRYTTNHGKIQEDVPLRD